MVGAWEERAKDEKEIKPMFLNLNFFWVAFSLLTTLNVAHLLT